MTASVLKHFNLKIIIYVETDTLNYVSRGVLLQKNKEENLHPVVYFLMLMISTECNYDIYNKKLLVIIHYLEQ